MRVETVKREKKGSGTGSGFSLLFPFSGDAGSETGDGWGGGIYSGAGASDGSGWGYWGYGHSHGGGESDGTGWGGGWLGVVGCNEYIRH